MMFVVTKPMNIMSKNTKLAGQPVICQLLSFIPRDIVDLAVDMHQSDKHYHTMTTYKQMVFMLYGVISKCSSLNSLCKNLLFLDEKLIYLGIEKLPPKSTLSDANINRDSEVFASIYSLLYDQYKDKLIDAECGLLCGEEIKSLKTEIIDSSTISLFVDVLKGAGRNPIDGKKKGGLKIHAKLPLGSNVPDIVSLTEASCNDKKYLGQLEGAPGVIYVFDKGYANYSKWAQLADKGAYYVTRINENAIYNVIEASINHPCHYADGGIISDQIIELNNSETTLKCRLIAYKDPESGHVLQFVSNMFDFDATTVIQLYKYRWNIELFFKRLKQNFELGYFYSDNIEGIKTQVWMALIANLIFSVIHKMIREAEMFTTMVSMASNNMGSYVSFIKILTAPQPTMSERDIRNIQYHIFENIVGGVLKNLNNSS